MASIPNAIFAQCAAVGCAAVGLEMNETGAGTEIGHAVESVADLEKVLAMNRVEWKPVENLRELLAECGLVA